MVWWQCVQKPPRNDHRTRLAEPLADVFGMIESPSRALVGPLWCWLRNSVDYCGDGVRVAGKRCYSSWPFLLSQPRGCQIAVSCKSIALELTSQCMISQVAQQLKDPVPEDLPSMPCCCRVSAYVYSLFQQPVRLRQACFSLFMKQGAASNLCVRDSATSMLRKEDVATERKTQDLACYACCCYPCFNTWQVDLLSLNRLNLSNQRSPDLQFSAWA